VSTLSVHVGCGWPDSKPVENSSEVEVWAGWASSVWTVLSAVPAGARSIVSPTVVRSVISTPDRQPR